MSGARRVYPSGAGRFVRAPVLSPDPVGNDEGGPSSPGAGRMKPVPAVRFSAYTPASAATRPTRPASRGVRWRERPCAPVRGAASKSSSGPGRLARPRALSWTPFRHTPRKQRGKLCVTRSSSNRCPEGWPLSWWLCLRQRRRSKVLPESADRACG